MKNLTSTCLVIAVLSSIFIHFHLFFKEDTMARLFVLNLRVCSIPLLCVGWCAAYITANQIPKVTGSIFTMKHLSFSVRECMANQVNSVPWNGVNCLEEDWAYFSTSSGKQNPVLVWTAKRKCLGQHIRGCWYEVGGRAEKTGMFVSSFITLWLEVAWF